MHVDPKRGLASVIRGVADVIALLALLAVLTLLAVMALLAVLAVLAVLVAFGGETKQKLLAGLPPPKKAQDSD